MADDDHHQVRLVVVEGGLLYLELPGKVHLMSGHFVPMPKRRGPNSRILVSTGNLYDGGEAQISQHPLPDGRVRLWVTGRRDITDIAMWRTKTREGIEIVLSRKKEPDTESDGA